ncbi:hypothetical protein POM88_049161 [Heracleum sosnowskyi]|uniref:F-box associated beta-propeller type 1 domain-containing protein n=1 Tax=Heracleum sosnowskyi TaxID=360622 RepID=A0AAD8LZ93_9APIA|nr:hypothetical protein POM88_049161 [Heracleum sosnowskyi]
MVLLRCILIANQPRSVAQTVYLWNPSIRKLKVVPEFRKHGKLDKAIGFWFNAEENDYEVVRIGYTGEMSFVEVYSLSSNSWKMINETCPGADEISDRDLVYVKGKLHWLATQEHGRIIVSLDMNNGKFGEKLISSSCPSGTKFYLSRVHGHSLAILRCVWSRNAFGVQKDGCSIEVYDENLTMVSRDSYDCRGQTLYPVGPFAGAILSLSMFVVGLLLSSDTDAARDMVQFPSMMFQGSLLFVSINRADLGYVYAGCNLSVLLDFRLPPPWQKDLCYSLHADTEIPKKCFTLVLPNQARTRRDT